MKELQGRIAVVTGAASGIGFALAERFAAEGMKVVLADVEAGALQQAERALQAKGATTLALRTDVSQRADVDALAQRTFDAFGAVHVLCNNAGVGGEPKLNWESSHENWQWVLGVNLWGVINGIRAFVPRMLEQGTEGHVVNTASMAGHLALPMLGPYHATKFAVVAISESMYYELGLTNARLKVSVLCPGFVQTNIMNDQRNRPAALGASAPASEAEQAFRASFEHLVAAGIPPARVAATVVDAIREERFYVFPHPELLAGVRMRMENVIGQTNPSVDGLGMLQAMMVGGAPK